MVFFLYKKSTAACSKCGETEPVTGHKFVIAESLVASEQWTLLCCTVLGQHNEDSGHQQTE